MPNWETFTFQGSKRATVLRVTLSIRRIFALNQLAFDEIGKPEFVELLFDRKARLIGLKPSKKNVKHAYPIRKQGKNRSYIIAGKAFCTYYGITVSHSVWFTDVTMQEGVMVLDLNKTTKVTQGKTKAG